MFPYRELFLAVTISLTSVVFADVIVQPGYDHFGKNPYSQPASHQISSQTEQYHTKQLPNQELRYLQSARTVYPYYQSKDYSNLVGYPYHPFHHYSPNHHFSSRNHPHYARIGSHEYSRPSVFVGYRQPSIGHYHHWGSPHHYHRYRRSLDSDSTNTESSESTNVAHDNDVASKSPLTDDKYPKATDSLLPEHEPTDTNDKHVENRQVNKPHIFSVPYPQYIQAKQDTQYTLPELSGKQDCDEENLRLLTNRPYTRIRFEFPEEPSNNHNREYRQSGNDFINILLNNMRHQWAGHYHVYTPSYTTSGHSEGLKPEPAIPFLEIEFAKLENKYEQLLTYLKNSDIEIPRYFQQLRTRQSKMKSPIPFYRQMFSSTTDAPITKNEEDTSWTPDTAEITRHLEQDDLPKSYTSLVSDFDQGNYPHYCPNCYKSNSNYYKFPQTLQPSLDDIDNSDFQSNYNSAHNIEPSISIPNYSYIPNYDPNYAPDISVLPGYESHKD